MVHGPPANQKIRFFPIRNHTYAKTVCVTAGNSSVILYICKWYHRLFTEFKLTGLLKLGGE